MFQQTFSKELLIFWPKNGNDVSNSICLYLFRIKKFMMIPLP